MVEGPVCVGRVDHVYALFEGTSDEPASLRGGHICLKVTQGERPEDKGGDVKSGVSEFYGAQDMLLSVKKQ